MRHWLVLAAIVAGAILLVAAFAPRAEAHHGYAWAAGYQIKRSNMNGQCGNGSLSYCYPEYNWTWGYSLVDAHTWKMRGYWQERRIGHGRYACTAVFLAGPHGRGWLPYSERCYRL